MHLIIITPAKLKSLSRTAYAVRDLPASSRIHVKHYGKAHNKEWTEKAKQEMKTNPCYHWYGEIKHWQIRQQYARCHLMVLSSVMEGGANVIMQLLREHCDQQAKQFLPEMEDQQLKGLLDKMNLKQGMRKQ